MFAELGEQRDPNEVAEPEAAAARLLQPLRDMANLRSHPIRREVQKEEALLQAGHVVAEGGVVVEDRAP